MSHNIIDRTVGNKNKGSVNRQKFIKRGYRKIKEAVKDYIANDADIKDISNNKSKTIRVKTKGIDEPHIIYDPRGNDRKQVYVGNKRFNRGDSERKEPSGDGSGRGRQGSRDSDEFDDEFYFSLTYDEFVDIFFDDLELPNLIKKQLKEAKHFELHPAGYSTDGPPSRLDLRKTLFNSIKRNFAIVGNLDEEIEKLENQLKEDDADKEQIQIKLKELMFQKENIPFIQDLDLRYRKNELKPIPAYKAVMICIMDISGSMTEWHKEISKRFFMLLYMFLNKQYKDVELVFIRHHHEAEEVDEEEFFYSRESGGTVVSNALELAYKIIQKRYNIDTCNVYICQASDGDNIGDEMEDERLAEFVKKLMPKIQYFAYIEVDSPERKEFFNFAGLSKKDDMTYLMKSYNTLKTLMSASEKEKFNIRFIDDAKDLFQVFRSLFGK